MTFEEHCEESERLFGRRFEEVHLWLDGWFDKGLGARHRRVRHHEAGIKQAIEFFGREAGEVLRQHIISDLREEGWKETDPFPKDEEEYFKMALF